jgi:hypothetical protein
VGFEASERYCDASLILESIVSRGKVLTPPAAFEGLSTPLALSIIDCTSPAETEEEKMSRKIGGDKRSKRKLRSNEDDRSLFGCAVFVEELAEGTRLATRTGESKRSLRGADWDRLKLAGGDRGQRIRRRGVPPAAFTPSS